MSDIIDLIANVGKKPQSNSPTAAIGQALQNIGKKKPPSVIYFDKASEFFGDKKAAEAMLLPKNFNTTPIASVGSTPEKGASKETIVSSLEKTIAKSTVGKIAGMIDAQGVLGAMKQGQAQMPQTFQQQTNAIPGNLQKQLDVARGLGPVAAGIKIREEQKKQLTVGATDLALATFNHYDHIHVGVKKVGGKVVKEIIEESGDDILKQVRKITKPQTPKINPITRVKDGVTNFAQKVYDGMISEFGPLRRTEKRIYSALGKEKPSLDLTKKFELVHGAAGKAEADVRSFTRTVVDQIGQHYDDFNDYLFFKRSISRLQADPELKKVGDWTLDKLRLGLFAQEKKLGAQTFNLFETIGVGKYQKAMDEALLLQVSSGRMTKEAYDYVKASNDFYAPFKVLKYLENEGATAGGKGITNLSDLTKAITGISEEDLQLGDIVLGSAQNIYRSRILAEKNMKMLDLGDLAKMDTTGEMMVLRSSENVSRRVEIYKEMAALRDELIPKLRELKSTKRVDRKAASRIAQLEKQIDDLSRTLEKDFSDFMNEGDAVSFLRPATSKVITVPPKFEAIATVAKKTKTFEEFRDTTEGFMLERLDLSGELETAGFSSMDDFFEKVNKGVVKTEGGATEKTVKGSIEKVVAGQKKITRTGEKLESLKEIAKTSIEDAVNYVQKTVDDINLRRSELYKEARALADKKLPVGYERISYLRDGIKESVAVPKAVADSVRGLANTAQTGFFVRAFRLAATPFRVGSVVANAGFQVVNTMLDVPRAVLMSKYGATVNPIELVKLPLDFISGFYSSFLKHAAGVDNPLYKKFLESGMANSTISRDLSPNAFIPKIKPFKALTAAEKIARVAQGTLLDTWGHFAAFFEEGTKLAGVKRAFRMEGVDKLPPEKMAAKLDEIASEIRNYFGSPDFPQGGPVAREFNLAFPFFKARLLGVEKDFERLFGLAGGKKEAMAAWGRLTTLVGIPTIVLYFWNNDSEHKEDFEMIPDWEKNNYYMIPRDKFFTNNEGVRIREYWHIPKRGPQQLYSNMIEAAAKFAQENNPDELGQFGISFLENISPINIEGDDTRQRLESIAGSTNPLIKAPYELISGRNPFFHTDTVPQRLKQNSPELQYTPGTPEIYKKAGAALNMSPLAVEQFTNTMTGGFANQFVVDEPQKGRESFTTWPVIKRFVRSGAIKQSELERGLALSKQAQADSDFLLHEKAEKVYEQLKELPKDEANKKLNEIQKTEPLLRNEVGQIIIDNRAGLTYAERGMKSLNVKNGARAQFIFEHALKIQEAEKRNLFLNELRAKKVISAAVDRQLAELIKANRQTKQSQPK